MSAAITVAGLTKRYGALTAVDGISFEVAKGTIFGLLGPNGAGKTSVVECLVGLRQPDAGTVHLAGIDARAQPRRARAKTGVALQTTALQDRMTPREALGLFGAFYPDAESPETLLERFRLLEKADVAYDSLSAGQKQRLALALAFVNGPEILFLDEPTAGLDASSRRELHEIIRRQREGGCTVLLTTHDLAEAHALCDHLAILRGGHIVASAHPDALIARHPAPTAVALRTARPLVLTRLEALPAVNKLEVAGQEAQFQTFRVGQAMTGVIKMLEDEGNELLDLRVWRPSLEDTFLELTGGQSAPSPTPST